MKFFRIFAILIAILLLAGCSANRNANTNTQDDQQPASSIAGYFDLTQSIAGGEQSMNVNLKNIDIRTDGEDTIITLSFVQGSAASGEQEIPLEVVPYFVTGFQQSPYRFTINIEGLEYWDFKYDPAWNDSALFQALLLDLPMSLGDDVASLYFHLTGPVAYRLEEKADALVFRLRAVPETRQSAFCVTLNAFYDRSNSDFPTDLGMYPVLCSNLKDALLIGEPHATQQEAEAELASITQKLAANYPEKQPQIVQLAAGILPEYDQAADLQAVASKPVAVKDGSYIMQPVLATEGRFLEWVSGSEYLCSKPSTETATVDGTRQWMVTDELWLYANGQPTQRIVEYEFSSILSAKLSPDGSQLAVLEMLDDLHFLYLLDMQTRRITPLTDMEFGLDTPAFAWGDDGTLYAVTGDDSYSIMALQDGRTHVVSDNPGYTETLMFAGNCLYLLPFGQEIDSAVIEMDPVTGNKRELGKATGITINPTGTQLLGWRTSTSNPDAWYSFDLFMLDLLTGEETAVMEPGISVMNALWLDNTYWCVALEDAESQHDAYYTSLYLSDNLEEPICQLVSSEIYNGRSSAELLLVNAYISKTYYIPATYVLDLNALR